MSSTIVMMAFFAAAAPQFMFLHSSESFIWAFGMMLKGTDKTVNFWDYAYQATFINLIYYALSMATVYIVKGRETLVSGAHFSTFIEQSCRAPSSRVKSSCWSSSSASSSASCWNP